MLQKTIILIGGENYSANFEYMVKSNCSANKYFFGTPNRGIQWKIRTCSIKFLTALRALRECAPSEERYRRDTQNVQGENYSANFGCIHWIYLREQAHKGIFFMNKDAMENFQLNCQDFKLVTSCAAWASLIQCPIFSGFRRKNRLSDFFHCTKSHLS